MGEDFTKKHTLEVYRNRLQEAGLLFSTEAGSLSLATPVESISFNSKEVSEASLFICKGASFREEYLSEAMDRGAFCYVSERPYEGFEIPRLIVSDIRKAMAVIAALFYNEPWKRLNLIGLTGTKGKSTTVYFLKEILDGYYSSKGLREIGILSTIDTYDGESRFESHLTTPESPVLFRHFANAVRANLPAFVMEVSSQGLAYNRVDGVEFDYGCFLNFGIDHIGESEHSSYEDYLASKLMFFDRCKEILLNMDTAEGERVFEAAKKAALRRGNALIPYSPTDKKEFCGESAAYYSCEIGKEDGKTVFTVMKDEGGDYKVLGEFTLGISGLFNVENALLAVSLCDRMGIPMEFVKRGLETASVPGRMEVFEGRKGKLIAIVDYAHNALSFERLFASTKEEYPDFRIEVVFGCPGGKGIQRREELPEIVAAYADFAYVTEEDPGPERVEDISAVLFENLSKHGCGAKIINDREEAIEEAIKNAPDNTVILITAKGRETRQKRGDEYVPTISDVDVVLRHMKRK